VLEVVLIFQIGRGESQRHRKAVSGRFGVISVIVLSKKAVPPVLSPAAQRAKFGDPFGRYRSSSGPDP
jgi:hypothetical protein